MKKTYCIEDDCYSCDSDKSFQYKDGRAYCGQDRLKANGKEFDDEPIKRDDSENPSNVYINNNIESDMLEVKVDNTESQFKVTKNGFVLDCQNGNTIKVGPGNYLETHGTGYTKITDSTMFANMGECVLDADMQNDKMSIDMNGHRISLHDGLRIKKILK